MTRCFLLLVIIMPWLDVVDEISNAVAMRKYAPGEMNACLYFAWFLVNFTLYFFPFDLMQRPLGVVQLGLRIVVELSKGTAVKRGEGMERERKATYFHLQPVAFILYLFDCLFYSFSGWRGYISNLFQYRSSSEKSKGKSSVEKNGGGAMTHISLSINSKRPSTAMTASVLSCFRRTGPTSL